MLLQPVSLKSNFSKIRPKKKREREIKKNSRKERKRKRITSKTFPRKYVGEYGEGSVRNGWFPSSLCHARFNLFTCDHWRVRRLYKTGLPLSPLGMIDWSRVFWPRITATASERIPRSRRRSSSFDATPSDAPLFFEK